MSGLGDAIGLWLVPDSCAEASRVGWWLGTAAGMLVDIVVVLTILQAPRLNQRVQAPELDRGVGDDLAGSTGLSATRALIAIIAAGPWIAGLYGCWGPWVGCTATSMAGGSALLVGVLCLLVMLTAANQIGERSIR